MPHISIEKPFISVIIPTYNRASLLPRAINSVLNQSFSNFELIVIDDGSTDDTKQVMERFKDSRVRYLYQTHIGATDARNLGEKTSTGTYITFLDSDDEALPTWLEHFFKAIKNIGAGIICCGCIEIQEEAGKVNEKIILPTDMGASYGHQTGLFRTGGTFALRREVFEAVGGYTPGLMSSQNSELAMRLLPHCAERKWKIHNLFVPLIKHYIHKGASIRKDPKAILQGTKQTLRQHSYRLRKTPQTYANYCAVAGVNAARLGQYGEARHFLIAAIRAYPWYWKHYSRLFLVLVPPLARRVWMRFN